MKDMNLVIIVAVEFVVCVVVFFIAYRIRRKEERDKDHRKAVEEEKSRKADKMVNALSESYSFVCYIYPLDNRIEVYRAMGVFERFIGMYIDGTNFIYPSNFDEVLRDLIPTEDFEDFLKATDRYSLMPDLLRGEQKNIDFKVKKEYGGQWYRIALAIDKDNGNVILGIKNVESEHSHETRRQIIDALSTEFDIVEYVDLDTQEETIFRVTGGVLEVFPDWDSISNFTDRMAEFMEKFVVPEDRGGFYYATKKSRVLKELENKESYYVNVRVNIKEVRHFYQLKFVLSKVSDDSEEKGKTRLIVGFRNVDAEVKDEQEKKEMLEQALRMAKSASEAKTFFLNNVSHDIRTPMNAIVGFTTLAKDHIEDKKQVLDYLDKIEKSSNHLLSLINDVLDMSRIESGKMNIDEKKEDIIEMFDTVEKLMGDEAKNKNVALRIDYSEIVDTRVICDKLRFNQVLINIISNAIKYSTNGGIVEIKAKETNKLTSGYVSYEITIEDNGIGISEEFLKKIYDPFSRVMSSTVSGIQGTGLGMAITKSIVDMMGGTIDVSSKEGVGTKVILRFDFMTYEEKEPKNVEKSNYQFEGKSILLVEDVDLNREIAERILVDCGFKVDTASNGLVAYEKVSKEEAGYYDVILMDVQMPVMNGYEATKKIREIKDKKIAHLPIIAMTANAFEEDRKAALSAGMDEYVPKPINVAKLKETISKFV